MRGTGCRDSRRAAASTGYASIAGIWWHDTTDKQIKVRDQANTAWIVAGALDETAMTFSPAAATRVDMEAASSRALDVPQERATVNCATDPPISLPVARMTGYYPHSNWGIRAMPDPDRAKEWRAEMYPASREAPARRDDVLDDEEKVVAGQPDVNMTALLTRDVLGG